MSNENLDLTKAEDVKELMRTSKDEQEWNNNCVKVKQVNNGYPDFWFREIIISGLYSEVKGNW